VVSERSSSPHKQVGNQRLSESYVNLAYGPVVFLYQESAVAWRIPNRVIDIAETYDTESIFGQVFDQSGRARKILRQSSLRLVAIIDSLRMIANRSMLTSCR
jgi:hypothetical protein